MAERQPINYLDYWYRKGSYDEIEASFKSSQDSISISMDGFKITFATTDGEKWHAQLKTTKIEDEEEVPTTFGNMIALLQTSLDKDPDNPLNPILKSGALKEIHKIQLSLDEESRSLEILDIRVRQYEGRDREMSMGHP